MKYGEVAAACLFILLITVSSRAQSDPEKDVRKVERAWLDAYETRDAKAMDSIVGEEFFIIFPNGQKQTKPQLMEQIRRSAPQPGKRMKFRTEDVKAKVDGNTVVLTGRVIAEIVSRGK